MNPENAIELRNVNLTYTVDVEDKGSRGLFKKGKTKKENHVLDNISLDVKKGEILGIIGTNGAGKSTLLSVMARILEPDSGTVEINGKIATILELGIGFHQDLTGRENIILKGELYGFSKKQMESKIDSIIDYSGIRNYIDNPVRTYSSGMRSRLAFSIMMNVDAEIMLVDEILSTGDATFSVKASDYFKKILKDGKTVVYVSHSPGSIESLCTRAIWIDKGKIIANGRPKKVCAQYYQASMESFDVILDQAKSGLSEAQYRLALMYKEGINVEQNDELYHRWLELAAEQGHINAQVEMADLLIKSEDEEKRNVAMVYYQSSASRGDAVARSRLSILLGRDDVRKEHAVIKAILQTAASRGNPSDLLRYANFMLKTAWDDNDRAEAFASFKKLVDFYNHPDALVQLSVMYRDGIGVKKDKEMYIEVLKKGERLGVLKAINMLADVYSAGVLIDEDQEMALKLYEKCARMGSIPCQYTVGMMYLEGRGTEPNAEKSEYWFDQYSKSQLMPYLLNAISYSKNINVEETKIQQLYEEIEGSYDIKALMELNSRIKERGDLYKDNGRSLLEDINKKLSESYGKGMSVALQYYSRIDSVGYDVDKANMILFKSLYLGDVDQIYNFAISNRENESFRDEADRLLKFLAKDGYVGAQQYCTDHEIPY